MKRNAFWSIIAFSMMAILGMGLISCGDDDKDEKGGSNSSLIGSWSGLDQDDDYTTITFNSDGMGSQSWRGGDEYEYFVFEYSTNGDILYVFDGDEYMEFHYSVSGNTLTLSYIGENGHPANRSFTDILTKSGAPISSTKPLGTWKGNSYEEEFSFTFKSNGRGSYVYSDGPATRESGDFRWTMITSTIGGILLDNKELYFELVGNRMYLITNYGENKILLTKQ